MKFLRNKFQLKAMTLPAWMQSMPRTIEVIHGAAFNSYACYINGTSTVLHLSRYIIKKYYELV